MKINISIDATPEEFRQLLGTDKLQEMLMDEFKKNLQKLHTPQFTPWWSIPEYTFTPFVSS